MCRESRSRSRRSLISLNLSTAAASVQLVKSMSRLRGGGAGGGAVHRQDSSETTVSQSENHTPEAFRNSEKKGETSFTKRNIKTQVSRTLPLLSSIGIYIYN